VQGLKSTAVVMMLAGALSSTPAGAVRQETHGGRRPLRLGHTVVPETKEGPLTAVDAPAIARKWGIQIESMRLTSSGYMLDFRYRVVDASKAQPLFERKIKPVLRDDASGAEMAVPVPPKTGALRSSNDAKAGRTYFMFFANPARFVKKGNTVTVTIGAFSVSGIAVDDEAATTTATEGAGK
jgi:hypothetical protein